MELTDQQKHLQACIDQQRELLDDMQKLQAQINEKRDLAVKLQGIIEYLQGQGVELPKEEAPAPEAAEEAKEDE
jgi:peptidoglycan hydrolase CwlO-like protein